MGHYSLNRDGYGWWELILVVVLTLASLAAPEFGEAQFTSQTNNSSTYDSVITVVLTTPDRGTVITVSTIMARADILGAISDSVTVNEHTHLNKAILDLVDAAALEDTSAVDSVHHHGNMAILRQIVEVPALTADLQQTMREYIADSLVRVDGLIDVLEDITVALRDESLGVKVDTSQKVTIGSNLTLSGTGARVYGTGTLSASLSGGAVTREEVSDTADVVRAEIPDTAGLGIDTSGVGLVPVVQLIEANYLMSSDTAGLGIDTSGVGLVGPVQALEDSQHTHGNKSTLDAVSSPLTITLDPADSTGKVVIQ